MEFQRFLGQDVQFNVCRRWCRKDAKVSFLGRTGYGYICRLTEKTALELNAAALVSCSHPDVKAKYTGGTVEKENLGLSRSWNAGLLFTIGLVF